MELSAGERNFTELVAERCLWTHLRLSAEADIIKFVKFESLSGINGYSGLADPFWKPVLLFKEPR